jgi:hypothetical protein
MQCKPIGGWDSWSAKLQKKDDQVSVSLTDQTTLDTHIYLHGLNLKLELTTLPSSLSSPHQVVSSER